MVITEFLEIKFDFLETVFSGKAVIVVQDGKPILKNLKKLRLTVDRLEIRLRQNGVHSFEDVKIATLEISGQLGYELKDEKRPLTKEDFMTIMSEIADIHKLIKGFENTQKNTSKSIFDEVLEKKTEGSKEP